MLSLSASSRAYHMETYLFEGNVALATGCLLAHALAVDALAEDSKADGGAVVASTGDLTEDEDVRVTPQEESDDFEDVPDAIELEIGGTVR